MVLSKSVVIRLEIEGSHLRCKATNKFLNVREQPKMVGRNKDSNIQFLAVL